MSQLSVAVTVGTAGTASQSTESVAAGMPTSTGASVSVTVIVCVNGGHITAIIGSCPGSYDLPQPFTTVLDTSWKVTGTSVSQLSVAVTAGTAGTARSLLKALLQEYLPALVLQYRLR